MSVRARQSLIVVVAGLSAVGAGLVAAVGRGALVVLAALVVAVLLAVAVRSTKAFLGLATLAVVASPSLQRWFPALPLGVLDEAAVLLAVVAATVWRVHAHRSLRGFPGGRFFVLYALLGVGSALVAAVPDVIWLQALSLAVKGILIGWAFAQLDWTAADLRRICGLGVVLILVLAACAAVNFVDPNGWARLVGTTDYVDFRYGLPSINGPFVHPAAFGRTVALLALGVMAYSAAFGSTRLTRVLVVLTCLMAILSFRRKTIVGLLSASVVTRFYSSKGGTVLAVVLLFPLVAAALWQQISSTVTATVDDYVVGEAARTRLTVDSAHLAVERFPLGTGFGRFGSATARDYYSPEYVRLGYTNVFGMGPDADVSFLTDTQWAAIVGESGWIGAAAFAAGLFYMIKKCVPHRNSADRNAKFLGVLAIGWFTLLLVESVAAPVYTSAPSYSLLFSAVGVLVSYTAGARTVVPTASGARLDRPAGAVPSGVGGRR